jgi:hypothetical protein
MGYAHSITVDLPYEQAVPRVKEAFAAQGFGTLTEIDVAATLRDKLGEQMEPYLILAPATPSSPTAPCGPSPGTAGNRRVKTGRDRGGRPGVACCPRAGSILALAMNGQTLPPDHGYPARVIVPGWLRAASIKWVGRIQVAQQPLYSHWNTRDYILSGPDYRPRRPGRRAADERARARLARHSARRPAHHPRPGVLR